MITVAEARTRLLALAETMSEETVPLRHAVGRVLARDCQATGPQPPFAASAMDGYAIAGAPDAGALTVIGEAAAGHPWSGRVGAGEAVRIFTGAHLPDGADRVVIQEDVTRDGDAIVLSEIPEAGRHIRPAGTDFEAGFRLAAPRRLSAADIALLAAMGHGDVPVRRRPRIALVMTGDELAPPGTPLSPGMIRASNGYGLAAQFEEAGAEARLLPIARDTAAGLRSVLALAGDADLVVTIGGASVGDHDLVASVGAEAGLDLAFHKVLMRPGKPLLAGRLGAASLVGLPGNPVSSMVCGVIFVIPLIEAMLGLAPGPRRHTTTLAAPVGPNGPREHYMRARLTGGGRLEVLPRQDSSLLTVLAEADALAIRPPDDGAREAGDAIDYIALARP